MISKKKKKEYLSLAYGAYISNIVNSHFLIASALIV